GPMLAVRLRILTRKTLGGIHPDERARVLDPAGHVVDGLFAVGEAARFGGGGVHGHRPHEGTLLGGCLFTVRVAAHSLEGPSPVAVTSTDPDQAVSSDDVLSDDIEKSLKRSVARSEQIEAEIAADPSRFRVLTGDRPTGRLHLGHYL